MPTYTYQCENCNHEMAVFHGMNESPAVACEACGSKKTIKLLGTGAGLIFKGSGFYETDYKRKSGGNGAQTSNNGKSEAKSTGTGSESASSGSSDTTSGSSSKAADTSKKSTNAD